MSKEKDETPLSKQAQEMDYSSFESENRRRRVIVIAAAIAFALICAAGFFGTIESIGSMSAHVHGVFGNAAEPQQSRK